MYDSLLRPDVQQMLQENDRQGLAEFCSVLHGAVVAEVLDTFDSADVWRVLENCPIQRQVEIFEYINLAKQVELVKTLDRERLSRLLEEMSSDDRADLLSRLEPEVVEDLLPLIASAERSDIRKLLAFPEYSAGAIMTTDYASLPENITVRDALDRLRKQAPTRETIYYVYILDDDRRLDGFISLQELILAKPDKLLADVMTRPVISVRVDDDQETVAQELGRYDFLAIPVVDSQNHLVGIVTHDDVLDVVQEEATEDAQLLGAVSPLDDSYLTTPVTTLVWKRGVWLVLLAFAAIATALALQQLQWVYNHHPWLILFLPLVMAAGGNSGSQSATLVIRTLAVEEIHRSDIMHLLLRELRLASLLGATLMTVGFLCAVMFVRIDHAIVVAITLFIVVLIATNIGAMLPLFLRQLGVDPALMSNPLLAALVDALGVLIYFTVAIILLGTQTAAQR